MNNFYGFISKATIGKNTFEFEKPFDPYEMFATSPRERVREAFKKYKIVLNDKDLDKTIQLMGEFYKDRTLRLYNLLPRSVQFAIDQICRGMWGIGIRENLNREDMAQSLFENVINNMGCELALMQLSDETVLKAKDMRDTFNKMYSDIFKSIDEIREEDPERAELVTNIKKAFEEAENFDRQIEYMNNDIPKNVRRYYMNFNSSCYEFNRKANVTPVRMHDMDRVYVFLRKSLSRDFTTDEVKAFITLLCRSTMDLDFSNIVNVAYVYRLLDNILKHNLTPDETFDTMIKNVQDVIIKMRQLILSSKKGR